MWRLMLSTLTYKLTVSSGIWLHDSNENYPYGLLNTGKKIQIGIKKY